MSYFTIAQYAADQDFLSRITACVSQETGTPNVPTDLIWAVCGASDVEAAYASALAGENPAPGSDETVITDQMILSHVQAWFTEHPSP